MPTKKTLRSKLILLQYALLFQIVFYFLINCLFEVNQNIHLASRNILSVQLVVYHLCKKDNFENINL